MGKAIIVCGPPASGKTTYAKNWAKQHGALLIDIDTATERLVLLALGLKGRDPLDRDSSYFKARFRNPIYEQLSDLACDNLPHADVLIVGPFTQEIRNPNWPRTLRQRLQAPIEVHYMSCPPRKRQKRMAQRANPRDLTKLEDWEVFMAYYGQEAPPCFQHVLIDNSGEPT